MANSYIGIITQNIASYVTMHNNSKATGIVNNFNLVGGYGYEQQDV